MSHKKEIGLGLLTALCAVLALAISASSALATEVLPANAEIEGKLEAGTMSAFYPTNAFVNESIRCTESKVEGRTPTSLAGSLFNQNKTGTGPRSTGPGSVFMSVAVHTFSTCGAYTFNTTTSKWEQVAPATVTTNNTNGNWSLNVTAYNETVLGNAIGVPKAAATIEVPLTGCIITVSPENASAPMSTWTNGTTSATGEEAKWSKDVVDGQIPYSANAKCAATTSPAQFEATYRVHVKAGGATPVTVGP